MEYSLLAHMPSDTVHYCRQQIPITLVGLRSFESQFTFHRITKARMGPKKTLPRYDMIYNAIAVCTTTVKYLMPEEGFPHHENRESIVIHPNTTLLWLQTTSPCAQGRLYSTTHQIPYSYFLSFPLFPPFSRSSSPTLTRS